MRRRRYLATLAAAAALAGCSGSGDGTDGGGTDSGEGQPDSGGGGGTDSSVPESGTGDGGSDGSGATGDGSGGATGTTIQQPSVPSDYELPIDRSKLNRGAGKDAIPAIVEPVFAPDWSGLGGDNSGLSLRDEDRVIGVERDGSARAYPLRVLNWHEVVNDDFGGPLLVTFCPLCGSGVTAERRVGGDVTRFGVSGLLWNSDLVMYDEKTQSLWSQLLGTAIRGPQTGETLSFVPSTLTTWGSWRDTHPETEVLLPPPESGVIAGSGVRDYERNPYETYDETSTIGIGFNDFEDDRLHPKASVIGVRHDGVAKAYPLEELGQNATVNDVVAGLPVVVASTGEGSLFAYERTVDGEALTFVNDGPRHLRADGSRWEKVSGRAVDGPHEGTTLARANDRSQLFWFAWADFYPDTAIYRA